MKNTVENKQLSRNDGNTVLCDVLSLEEAKHIAITEGKKIRHKYFLDNEYIYFDRGWKTEDGYDLPFAYFLGMDENWQTGWSEHIA